MTYYEKYIKYKRKYLELSQTGKGYEYLENKKKVVLSYDISSIFSKYFDDFTRLDVLEIGIGNVIKSIYIEQLFGFMSYDGLEPYNKLYELARKNCQEEKCNVNIINSDFEQYNTTKKYDVIMMFNVFHFFEEYNHMLDKMLSMLKKGGIIFIDHPKAIPVGWGDSRLNEDSPDFNRVIWDKNKKRLDNIKKYLIGVKNVEYIELSKDIFIIHQ